MRYPIEMLLIGALIVVALVSIGGHLYQLSQALR